MARIGTVGRVAAAQPPAVRPAAARAGGTPAPDAPPPRAEPGGRALTVVEGGRREGGRGFARAEAGFVAQLLAAADPTLWPSRAARGRTAAAAYADAARRTA